MSRDGETPTGERRFARTTWAVISVFAVESLIFGLAALPALCFWEWHLAIRPSSHWASVVFLAMALVPAYLIFAITLMILSAGAMKLLGWRAPPNATMRIEDLEWPLLNWARGSISAHVVRLFAGSLFRSTPLWTFYLRLNGARVGRGVYVNSLTLGDHSLLEFGDATVIGAGVHLSGHTVEGGVVKTGAVRLGRHVTIGVGSVIGIGVDIGDGTKVGALSFVPRGARLEAGATYVGIPVRRVEKHGPTPPWTP